MKKKTHLLVLVSSFLLLCASSASASSEQLSLSTHGGRGELVTVDPSLAFENPRIRSAYIALQAWKQAILSDANNYTDYWVGSDVCNYTGVFSTPAPDDPNIRTVAGIDLNHGDIAECLPEELGLLADHFLLPHSPFPPKSCPALHSVAHFIEHFDGSVVRPESNRNQRRKPQCLCDPARGTRRGRRPTRPALMRMRRGGGGRTTWWRSGRASARTIS